MRGWPQFTGTKYMTYCLAIKTNEGIVFASDSRTSAGVDYIRTYSKMHSFVWQGDRSLVLLSSGNLATTQAVVNHIHRDLSDDDCKVNLKTVKHLYDAAHYIGTLSQREQSEHAAAFKDNSDSLAASFILGGQIGNQKDDIYLIYPEGNYITVSLETPYMQIGETKYGKPILDRIINHHTSLNDAARCALVSLDSTMRSNVSVGPPLELAMYNKDSLMPPHHMEINVDSPFYQAVQQSWGNGLQQAFSQLPRFEWEMTTDKIV